jgi:predicted GTPase
VEDGPTLTHGEMAFGAGFIAANQFQAAEIIDPRPFAVGSIKKVYQTYPHMGPILPAMGYSAEQIKDLETTINNAECDLVLFATPIQLSRVLTINKPILRVRYEYRDYGSPTLEECLTKRLKTLNRK